MSPLSIILPQMDGYIKYFENGGKNMSFKIEEDDVYIRYNQIWNKIKELLGVNFYSEPIYEDKYIKTKVKTFSSIISFHEFLSTFQNLIFVELMFANENQ